MDEARNIWRDMRVRKYGSGGGVSIRWVKFSTGVNGNGRDGVGGTGSSAGSKSLAQGWLS